MNSDNNNSTKGDSSIPNNIEQNQSQSNNSQRSSHGYNTNAPTTINNNKSRSNQTDKQHGTNNQRRYSNYGGNRHNQNSRNRHTMDPNIVSNITTSSSSPSSIQITSSNSHGKSGHYHSRNAGNRYEQNNHYNSGTRNIEAKNTQQTVVSNQPLLDQSLINNMDEFPSLNDPTTITHKVNQESQKNPINTQKNQFYLETSISTPALTIGNNPTYSQQHQSINNTNNRQYHGNRRGGYNKNHGPRDHQSNYGKGNYNRSSTTASQQNPTISSTTSTPAVTNNPTQSGNYQQHGINNMRPRGGGRRGGMNNPQNYEHNRRSSTRDYNQLPTMMNGMRVGVNPTPITPIPITYFNTARPYQPIISHLQPNIAPRQNVPLTSETNNVANTVPISKPAVYLPGESPQDLSEAERYKELTGNTSTLPKEEQIKNQIEFYFSNNNLKNDAFLRTHMDNDGWVSASVILKFHRISKFQISCDMLIPMIDSSSKLEYKIDNGTLMIRRINEPAKWTTAGLEFQKQELYHLYPELEQPQDSNIVIPNPPHAEPVQHLHHIPYSVTFGRFPHVTAHPGYVGPYAPSQVALGYPIYPYDDMNNSLGIVYDPNSQATYDLSAPYPEPTMITSILPDSEKILRSTNSDYSSVNQKMHPISYSESSYQYTSVTSENGYPTQSSIHQRAPNNQKGESSKPTSRSYSAESGNLDSNLNETEYQDCFKIFLSERENQNIDITNNIISEPALRIYRYWTQNLVLNFENDKYFLFKKYAIEDSKRHMRDGVTLLYQFYERFLHRYPLTTPDPANSTTELQSGYDSSSVMKLSPFIFDDFQQVSYDDYTHGESVFGLKKLLRFKGQFSNPSRQPPPFKSHVQQLIDNLGLGALQNSPTTEINRNSDPSNPDTTTNSDESSKKIPDINSMKASTSTDTSKQSNISTHH